MKRGRDVNRMLWLNSKRKLGSRVLRIGLKGSDVLELQKRLGDLGYQPGPLDGIFSYLTQEALQYFQRDYSLQIDGVAGKEVYSLLLCTHLPVNRRVHIVTEQQTLADIAKLYHIGKEAFREFSKKRSLYAGQQLVFFDRQVWGTKDESLLAKESMERNSVYLTGVVSPMAIDQKYKAALRSPTSSTIASLNVTPTNCLLEVHQFLVNRRRKKQCLQLLSQSVGNVNGVYLPWCKLSRVDGRRYSKFVRQVRRVIGDKTLMTAFCVDMPRWNVFGGVDFAELSRDVNQVVIRLPVRTNPQPQIDKQYLEPLIHEALRDIPCWKLLLEIPVYAFQYALADGQQERKVLAYQVAMTKIFRQGARAETDENQQLYYRCFEKGVEVHIRIPSIPQLRSAIALVNRYNLAGVLLDSLGMEDKRLWSILQGHFSIAKFL